MNQESRWGEAAGTCALLLVTTLSCAQISDVQRSDAAAKSKRSATAQLADLEAQMVWPQCDLPPKPGKCGLESDRWLEESSTSRFVRE